MEYRHLFGKTKQAAYQLAANGMGRRIKGSQAGGGMLRLSDSPAHVACLSNERSDTQVPIWYMYTPHKLQALRPAQFESSKLTRANSECQTNNQRIWAAHVGSGGTPS